MPTAESSCGIRVSEEVYDELKKVKKLERFCTLDDVIRHRLGMPGARRREIEERDSTRKGPAPKFDPGQISPGQYAIWDISSRDVFDSAIIDEHLYRLAMQSIYRWNRRVGWIEMIVDENLMLSAEGLAYLKVTRMRSRPLSTNANVEA